MKHWRTHRSVVNIDDLDGAFADVLGQAASGEGGVPTQMAPPTGTPSTGTQVALPTAEAAARRRAALRNINPPKLDPAVYQKAVSIPKKPSATTPGAAPGTEVAVGTAVEQPVPVEEEGPVPWYKNRKVLIGAGVGGLLLLGGGYLLMRRRAA